MNLGSDMLTHFFVCTLAVLDPDIVLPDLVFSDAFIRMIGDATHATLRGMGFVGRFSRHAVYLL